MHWDSVVAVTTSFATLPRKGGLCGKPKGAKEVFGFPHLRDFVMGRKQVESRDRDARAQEALGLACRASLSCHSACLFCGLFSRMRYVGVLSLSVRVPWHPALAEARRPLGLCCLPPRSSSAVCRGRESIRQFTLGHALALGALRVDPPLRYGTLTFERLL